MKATKIGGILYLLLLSTQAIQSEQPKELNFGIRLWNSAILSGIVLSSAALSHTIVAKCAPSLLSHMTGLPFTYCMLQAPAIAAATTKNLPQRTKKTAAYAALCGSVGFGLDMLLGHKYPFSVIARPTSQSFITCGIVAAGTCGILYDIWRERQNEKK